MLGRPNPYRKARAKGSIDDLMFDMDKRRHTSFRFQNYQNFITDRPGKLVRTMRRGEMERATAQISRWALSLTGFSDFV